MDQSDPFESALSSLVSSPIASNTHEGDDNMIREVIGKLGSICDSGGISPGSCNNSTTNTSCYNTPLNSPPKLSLSIMDQQLRGNFPISGNNFPFNPSSMPFIADPGFTERAARFSCFGVGNINITGLNGHLGLSAPDFQAKQVNRPELGRFSVVSSDLSLKANARSRFSVQETETKFLQPEVPASTHGNGQTTESREGSSISEQITCVEIDTTGQSDANSRKRKESICKVKANESSPASSSAKDSKVAIESEEPNAKKTRPSESNPNERDGTNGNQKQNKDNSKPPEPPKDYIHVRARRGQATDSHSLAERVRREKISQRMKVLQDLVPGCNKVTGKAVMLDEIINYVQSLQCQVEFLSMKLATLNSRMDPNVEAFLTKDIFNSRGSLPISLCSVGSSGLPFYGDQPQQGLPPQSVISSNSKTQFSVNLLNSGIHKYTSLNSPPVDGYDEAPPPVWEDDLQSVVQMGIGQNQPQILEQGSSLAAGQMKIEL